MTHRNLARVLLWMTGTLFASCLLAVSVRELASALTVMEILAFRAGTGLLVMLAILLVRTDLRPMVRTQHPFLHLFRNSIHLVAQYLWAWTLLLLPLATVFALEFTAPAWALLLAVTFLRERMTVSRLGAVLFGLAGVLVILRPGFASFQPAALLILAAAFGFATNLVTTKRLTRTESSFSIIFWMNVIQFPLAMLGSDPLFLTKVSQAQLPALLGVGLGGLASHYCLANAFRSGDAAVVVPLDFLRIPLIAVVGWLLYGERVDVFVFLGAGLIVAGILWNLRSESARTTVPAFDPQEPLLPDAPLGRK